MRASSTTSAPVPLEYDEQCAFVEWLDFQGLRFTAIPNSTYTASFNQKLRNRRSGLRAGFPDLVVIIAPHQSKDGVGRFLCIEMKRRKGGTVAPEQAAWHRSIAGIDSPHVEVVVVKGADEAIAYVSERLGSVNNTLF